MLEKLMKDIYDKQVRDWAKRGSKMQRVEVEMTPDWSLKRMSSILGEAQRLEIKFLKIEGNRVFAEWKGLPLEGKFGYETRGGYHTSRWTRPRIALRFWVPGVTVDSYNCKQKGYLDYDGKYSSHYIPNKGGEALEIVFGKERMMVYNRLMVAVVNCMGKAYREAI